MEARQTFYSPVALLNYSAQGLTGLSHESQAFVQEHIIPKAFAKRERPILINNWEATYFLISEKEYEKLLNLFETTYVATNSTFVNHLPLETMWPNDRL